LRFALRILDIDFRLLIFDFCVFNCTNKILHTATVAALPYILATLQHSFVFTGPIDSMICQHAQQAQHSMGIWD